MIGSLLRRGGRRLAAAAMLGALASAPVRAEKVSFDQGPFELRGLHKPLEGPAKRARRVYQPGWIRGLSAAVVDGSGRPVDRGLLCHATLIQTDKVDLDDPAATEAIHLTLDDGQSAITFPPGYGLRVDPSHPVFFESMLQSEDRRNDGTYYVRFTLDYVPEAAASLRPLEIMTVRTLAPDPAAAKSGVLSWEVPPGHHVYERRFTPAFPLTAHYVWFHLHRYTTRVALLDARSGETLFDVPVRNKANGWVARAPFWSSRAGLPLLPGREYVYRTTYDNPTGQTLDTMSVARFYFERGGAR